MSLLTVSGVSKKEKESYLLKNINFVQQAAQKIAVAGETGSGKSTLLKIIAGLVQPDAGAVLFEGTRVKGPLEKLLPGHSQIAYLSQSFELRNNYRVEELLQMANKLSDDEAILVYNVCKIDHLLKRWSHELSGGERQRVAFALTLTSAPKLLLLDEPFSNLDAIHRSILKAVITDIEQRLNLTCILISHDPVDLLSWADEIIVLRKGNIIQKGAPEEVYYYPVNEYVASLFGKYNFVSPHMVQLFPQLAKNKRRFLRPNDFTINLCTNGIKAEIETVSFMGSFYELEVMVFGCKLIIITDQLIPTGSSTFVQLKANGEQGHHLE
jgi:ABC-type sugar transport system ATPase subunit